MGVVKKFISRNAVGSQQFLLESAQALRGANGSGEEIDLLKYEGSKLKLLQMPQVVAAPSDDSDLANKLYVDTLVSAKVDSSTVGVSIATLTNGVLSSSQIPSITITDTFEASTEAEMLSLVGAEKGDICIRSDETKTYVLAGEDKTVLSNWKMLKFPDGIGPIQTALDAEILRAQGAEAELAALISAESSARSAAILVETQAREAAILAEVSARELAVQGESEARVSGDASTLVAAQTYTDSELDKLTLQKQEYVLVDITPGILTSGFIDLQHDMIGVPWLMISNVMLKPGEDFTFSGNRITFAGDLMPGQYSALEDTDFIHVWYMRDFKPFM
jgi:hypothetical protein